VAERRGELKREVARVPLGNDELVVSITDHGKLDTLLWTATAGVIMASANGLTIGRADSPAYRRAGTRRAAEGRRLSVAPAPLFTVCGASLEVTTGVYLPDR
jgi:hypothetical protein